MSSSEVNPEMDAVRAEITGITTDEMIQFLLEKTNNQLRCVMCGSSSLHIVGTDEQLFAFAMPSFMTDRTVDTRRYVASVGECINCGYIHLFSPVALLEAKEAKARGKV
ncbi:hypothetical protein [Aeromonas sp. AE23HZ002T15]